MRHLAYHIALLEWSHVVAIVTRVMPKGLNCSLPVCQSHGRATQCSNTRGTSWSSPRERWNISIWKRNENRLCLKNISVGVNQCHKPHYVFSLGFVTSMGHIDNEGGATTWPLLLNSMMLSTSLAWCQRSWQHFPWGLLDWSISKSYLQNLLIPVLGHGDAAAPSWHVPSRRQGRTVWSIWCLQLSNHPDRRTSVLFLLDIVWFPGPTHWPVLYSAVALQRIQQVRLAIQRESCHVWWCNLKVKCL